MIASDHDDFTLPDQIAKRLVDHKRELSTIHESIISADLENYHELALRHSALESEQFDCSYKLKTKMSEISKRESAMSGKGVKLSKLDVPVFNGAY